MVLHFYKSYWNGVAYFQYFWGQKIQVYRDFLMFFFPKVTKIGSIISPQYRL